MWKPGAGALLTCGFLVLPAVASVQSAVDALQKAAMLVQQGHLDEAEQQARLALSDSETRAAGYSVLGAIRFQQKRLEESAGLLRKAIELEPHLVGAHLSLAQV